MGTQLCSAAPASRRREVGKAPVVLEEAPQGPLCSAVPPGLQGGSDEYSSLIASLCKANGVPNLQLCL